jgi:DTW domain-containing protein YfiP
MIYAIDVMTVKMMMMMNIACNSLSVRFITDCWLCHSIPVSSSSDDLIAFIIIMITRLIMQSSNTAIIIIGSVCNHAIYFCLCKPHHAASRARAKPPTTRSV